MFKTIFQNSQGPNSKKECLALASKGLLMGCADTVPGISGGTVAYLTGIYNQLLNAINSFDAVFFNHLKKGQIILAFSHVHTRFLILLFSGILTAIACMTRLVVYCLEEFTEYTFSFFFGLMISSTLLVFRELKQYYLLNITVLVLTTILTFWIVGFKPGSGSKELSYLFVFICGAIAICAMLLPGLSGSYLIMLLGVYHSVLSSIKVLTTPSYWLEGFPLIKGLNPLLLIVVFGLGCLTGIKSFSKLLSYMLKNYHQPMVGFICGLMVGSLRSIWPWQSRELGNSNTKIIENSAIEYWLPTIDTKFYIACVLAIIGFAVVIWLEYIFNRAKANSSENSKK